MFFLTFAPNILFYWGLKELEIFFPDCEASYNLPTFVFLSFFVFWWFKFVKFQTVNFPLKFLYFFSGLRESRQIKEQKNENNWHVSFLGKQASCTYLPKIFCISLMIKSSFRKSKNQKPFGDLANTLVVVLRNLPL